MHSINGCCGSSRRSYVLSTHSLFFFPLFSQRRKSRAHSKIQKWPSGLGLWGFQLGWGDRQKGITCTKALWPKEWLIQYGVKNQIVSSGESEEARGGWRGDKRPDLRSLSAIWEFILYPKDTGKSLRYFCTGRYMNRYVSLLLDCSVENRNKDEKVDSKLWVRRFLQCLG